MNRLTLGLTLVLLVRCDLPGATLVYRYLFNGVDDVTDSVGGNHGVLFNGATVNGTHLVLPGTGAGAGAANMGFTSPLEIGANFGTTGVSIETWYTDEGSGTWAKLFTFGTSAAGQEIAFTNRRGGGDLAPGLDRNGAKFLASYPQGSNTYIPPNVEHHLVLTVTEDGTTDLWIDGIKEIDALATNPLSNVVSSTESIGATAWNDPGHRGKVNEFRIYSGVLTEAEVQASRTAGPALPGDSDSDGLPDAWELKWFGSANSPQGAAGNPDSDGLTNLEEFQFNTLLDPTKNDTDADGLHDGREVKVEHTDPLLADTDGDTLSDGAELNTHHTNPLKRDTDDDRYPDQLELSDATNPVDPNSFLVITEPLLAHRYSFTANATDSVGTNHGILIGDAHVESGELVLDGFGDRMDFSKPVRVGENFGVTGISVESWYTDTGSGTWAKLFSFGTNAAGQELAYTHRRGNGETSGIDRDGAKLLGFDVSQNEEHYLAFTVSADGNLNGYLDGQPLPTIIDIDTNDLSNVTSTNEFIGESAWTVDPEHLGSVDEFRLWRGVLTPAQTAQHFQLGPDVIGGAPPSNFFITSVTYNQAANTATLVWNSSAGKKYTVWTSSTLATWTKLPGEVTSQGAQTSFTDSSIPAGTPTRFYYIQEEP